MKYFVNYDDCANIVSAGESYRSGYAPDVGFDDEDGTYYATVEADSKEQAIHKAFAMFLDVADARVEACKASFERVKNKFIEIAR